MKSVFPCGDVVRGGSDVEGGTGACRPSACEIQSFFLFLAEAFSLFNCIIQFFHELFIAFVRWKIEPVEARVATRQPRLLSDFLDAEMLRTVASWKFENWTDKKYVYIVSD